MGEVGITTIERNYANGWGNRLESVPAAIGGC